jgi:gliding motility-associated lipoprotein GldD
VYTAFGAEEFPCRFNVSRLAVVEHSPAGARAGWINLYYPALDARIYCSYIPATPSALGSLGEESRALVVRQAKEGGRIGQQAYGNPPARVYALLYESDGASPIQFTLTDSVAHFFRGALVYNHVADADSLEPVTRYLKEDVMELIQSFRWKEP